MYLRQRSASPLPALTLRAMIWFSIKSHGKSRQIPGNSGESQEDRGNVHGWRPSKFGDTRSLSLIRHAGFQGLEITVTNQITEEVYKAVIVPVIVPGNVQYRRNR